MSVNPEFRRNLWLELSATRLILAPLVMGAIFYLVYLMNDDISDFLDAVIVVSLILFGIILFLWGGKMVSESVTREVNEGTWEAQQMSAVSPWSMAWGKLFGSTIYAWYVGAGCVAAYLAAVFHSKDIMDRGHGLQFLLTLLLCVVMTHAVSLSLSLFDIRKKTGREKINSSFYFLCGLILMSLLGGWIKPALDGKNLETHWYLYPVNVSDFILGSAVFFTAWAVIGLHRNMRTALQESNGPWVWIAFLLSLMAYASGFVWGLEADETDSPGRWLAGLMLSYAIGTFMLYVTAFTETKDPVSLRWILDRLRRRQWREFGEAIPLWALTLILTVLVWGILMAHCLVSFPATGWRELKSPMVWLVMLLCFTLRDLMLLLFVNLGKHTRRADLAAAFYLMILYGLIPLILQAGDMEVLTPVFFPVFDSRWINGALPAAGQTILMAWLLKKRWTARNRLISTPV